MEASPPPDPALDQAHAIAGSAWPTLRLSVAEFAEYLQRHCVSPAQTPAPILQDLFLAAACARGVAGALRCFRERLYVTVALTVRRFDDSPAFVEEVYQRLSETLFVDGPDGQARIGRYRGHGSLAGFVSTAARRIALRMTATADRFPGEEALIEQLSEIHEQETRFLKAKYRDTFNSALSVALRQLPRRDRIILRMNLIERVSTSRIAAMYKVSQPTVSRWIQRSARTIFATVKDLVCDDLDIDTRELESLLILVRSQIEITISQAGGGGTTEDRSEA